MSLVSRLASVSSGAKIASDVTIEPFTIIYDDVEIGEGTWIGSNVTIMSGVRIGKNNKIFPGAVIGAIPQDLKFHGEYTTVQIGDNNVIRECVTINRGTEDTSTTKVGNNVLIMAYVHIAHDCIIGDHCILSNATQLAGHIVLEDYVIMGGMSGALQRLRVGKHAFVSGGTLIGKNVPPFVRVLYTPGNFFGINTLGLLRRNFTRNKMQHISDIYKLIYNSDLNTSQALEEIQNTIEDSNEKAYILSFIKNSANGIIPRYKSGSFDEGNNTL